MLAEGHKLGIGGEGALGLAEDVRPPLWRDLPPRVIDGSS
jgi:hypothetical protein